MGRPRRGERLRVTKTIRVDPDQLKILLILYPSLQTAIDALIIDKIGDEIDAQLRKIGQNRAKTLQSLIN